MSAFIIMNTSNQNEDRGTPYNHIRDSLALRSTGENQLVTRSDEGGASPTASSSADLDDSASSSMESNDTY
jgi:hypothetical protein